MKKPIIILITLLVLGGVLFVYQMYKKPHTDVAATEASEILSATDIFTAFDTDVEASTLQYSDKVIQVEGLLLSKEMSNEKEPQIVLEGDGDEGFVRCGFKPEELSKVMALTDSTVVKIKGMCIGFNGSDELDLLGSKDVVLSNCIIIE
jgi:hypothetical protein